MINYSMERLVVKSSDDIDHIFLHPIVKDPDGTLVVPESIEINGLSLIFEKISEKGNLFFRVE